MIFDYFLYLVFNSLLFFLPISTTRTRVALIKDNKVLLVKNRLGDNQWTLPGGGVKKGEQPHKAARREVMEELAINIEKATMKQIHKAERKIGLYTEHYIVYKTPAPSLRYKANRYEIREARWFEIDALPRRRNELVDAALS